MMKINMKMMIMAIMMKIIMMVMMIVIMIMMIKMMIKDECTVSTCLASRPHPPDILTSTKFSFCLPENGNLKDDN